MIISLSFVSHVPHTKDIQQFFPNKLFERVSVWSTISCVYHTVINSWVLWAWHSVQYIQRKVSNTQKYCNNPDSPFYGKIGLKIINIDEYCCPFFPFSQKKKNWRFFFFSFSVPFSRYEQRLLRKKEKKVLCRTSSHFIQ